MTWRPGCARPKPRCASCRQSTRPQAAGQPAPGRGAAGAGRRERQRRADLFAAPADCARSAGTGRGSGDRGARCGRTGPPGRRCARRRATPRNSSCASGWRQPARNWPRPVIRADSRRHGADPQCRAGRPGAARPGSVRDRARWRHRNLKCRWMRRTWRAGAGPGRAVHRRRLSGRGRSPRPVNYIAPGVDPQRGTVNIRLDVSTAAGLPAPGHDGVGERRDRPPASALAVPNDALLRCRWRPRRGARGARRPGCSACRCTLGLRSLALSEVIGGLQAGEVVLAGAARGRRCRTAIACASAGNRCRPRRPTPRRGANCPSGSTDQTMWIESTIAMQLPARGPRADHADPGRHRAWACRSSCSSPR